MIPNRSSVFVLFCLVIVSTSLRVPKKQVQVQVPNKSVLGGGGTPKWAGLFNKQASVVAAAEATSKPRAPVPVVAAAAARSKSQVASAGEEYGTDAFWKGVVCFLCVLWATNFASVKLIFETAPNLDPSLYATVRFGLAALVLLPIYIDKLSDFKLVAKSFTIGLFVFIAYLGQAVGLAEGSTADKSAFICSLLVVWVALITGVRQGSFSLKTSASVLLAVTGVGFLELEGSSAPVLGDLWSCLQPIGFGTSYVLIENIMKNDGKGQGPAVTGLRVLFIALASALWAIFSGQTMDNVHELLESQTALLALAYTGIITTAGGIYLQTFAFARVSSTDASIILSAEPVFAALFAATLLGESLNVQDLGGCTLIIIACVANEISLVRPSRRRGALTITPSKTSTTTSKLSLKKKK